MKRRYVNAVKTGENITRLMRLNKVKVFDIQMAMRMSNTTSIYNWKCGNRVPSIDSLLCLADLFHCNIEDIIVTEESDDE